MTITLAWIREVDAPAARKRMKRKITRTRELVIASDSRLRFGCAWDCGPKIMATSRGDCALAFAGDTQYAYPMILHMQAAIEYHRRSQSRAMDLTDLKGHLIRIANGMRDHISDLPRGVSAPETPDAVLILAGYSWKESDFRLWLLHYDCNLRKFTFRPASHWSGSDGLKRFVVAGDYHTEVKRRIAQKLREKSKLQAGAFNMEPFEVLRDMLRAGEYPTIGGAPQLMKVYRHMNAVPIAVRWPNGTAGSLSVLGRPLLPYERTQLLAIDPDTLVVDRTWNYDSAEESVSANKDRIAAKGPRS